MNLTESISKIYHYLNERLGKVYSFANMPIIKRLNFYLVILVSFVGILVLNMQHPLFGDDWMYSMLPEPSNEHVKNFSDILYTQYEHYFTWGGRSVVHVIAQSLLLLGKCPASILNSLAYVALTLVIYRFANKSNKINPSLLIGINLLVCIFQPAFASTMLWITGSANYLWGTLIILLFLLPYRLHVANESADTIFKTILFFIAGIVAGWTNENMAVALIVMLVLFLFYYKSVDKTIPKWAVAGLIGATIGCVMMLSAPGNYARMSEIVAQKGDTSGTLIFVKQFFVAILSYYYYCLGLTFVFFIVFALSKYYTKEWKTTESKALSAIFIIGAIVATLAMSASPIFPGRAAYGINILLVIAICILFANLDFEQLLIKRLTCIALTFGLLFFAADYYRGYKELSVAKQIYKERTTFVLESKSKGINNIVFTKTINEPQTRFFHHFDLPPDTADWHNRMYSRYYGVNTTCVRTNN